MPQPRPDIVDAQLVTHVVAVPSGRSFCQVQTAYTPYVGFNGLKQVEGSATFPYCCFDHYCTCPAFMNQCILKAEAYKCKHQLAARIAKAIGKARRVEIRDTQFAKAVCYERNTLNTTTPTATAS